jgi:hypothetical protein
VNKTAKTLLTLLLMAAVIAYTIYNYIPGRTNQTTFLVYMVILGIPFVNMIRILIQERDGR